MIRYWSMAIILALAFLFSSMYYDTYSDEQTTASLLQTASNVHELMQRYDTENQQLAAFQELIPSLVDDQQVLKAAITNLSVSPAIEQTETTLMKEVSNISTAIRAMQHHNNNIINLSTAISNDQLCKDVACHPEPIITQSKMINLALKKTVQGNLSFLMMMVLIKNASIQKDIITLLKAFNCDNATQLTTQGICWQILFLEGHAKKLYETVNQITIESPKQFNKWQQLIKMQGLLETVTKQNKQLGIMLTNAETTIQTIRDGLQDIHTTVSALKREVQKSDFDDLSDDVEKIEQQVNTMNNNINAFYAQQDKDSAQEINKTILNPKEIFKQKVFAYYITTFSMDEASFEKDKKKVLLQQMKDLIDIKEAGESYLDQEFSIIDSKRRFWSSVIKSRHAKNTAIYKQQFEHSLDKTLQFFYNELRYAENSTIENVLDANMQFLLHIEKKDLTPTEESMTIDVLNAMVTIVSKRDKPNLEENDLHTLFNLGAMLLAIRPNQEKLVSNIQTYNDQDNFGKEDIYLQLLQLQNSITRKDLQAQ